MTAVPAGGPSTINGVLYQLLWSLATLGGFRASGQRFVGEHLDQITLIVEPATGGDQQTVLGGKRVVTQLKARSTGDAWSLQDVISDVLPDLYRAVDLGGPEAEYHFVTEGHQGKWAKVEAFFRNLPQLPTGTEILLELSDTDELAFGRGHGPAKKDKVPFWDPGPYSSRKMFEKIAKTVHRRKPFSAESYEDTCRKVWVLLRGFRFFGRYSQKSVEDAVDHWLLARVGSVDALPQRRAHLLLDLARRACTGDAVVNATDFFAAHGLDGVPLTRWFELTERARRYLIGVLKRKGEDPSEDARPDFTRQLLASWGERPILVLTGESGSGKSWHGYRALIESSGAGDVALLVDAQGDADRDLVEAAETFWHHIAGRDEAPPLARLRSRLTQLDPANKTRRITLLVDNVTDLEEARRLAEADWEGWGVRLAMSCATRIAEALRSRLAERGRVVHVPDFTLDELREFMSDVVGVDWEHVPFDVAGTLRRPLLAKLFRDVVPPAGWEQRTEYDLYELSWNRLRDRGVRPFDLEALRRLALGVLTADARYPWTPSDLRVGYLDNDAVDRITATGWLRETTSEAYEIWHDRLLSWTIAEAVVHAIRHDRSSAKTHAEAVAKLLVQPRAACGRLLGYVPMDVLWLLNDPKLPDDEAFRSMVGAYEAVLGWRSPEVLLRGLLPTLGPRAAPILSDRLGAAAESGPSYVVHSILEGLVATGEGQLSSRGLGLLADASPKVRRMGARLLTRCPTATALPRLWDLHVDSGRAPALFLWEREQAWSLSEDTFAALKVGVRLDPEWLERAINDADPTREPVHDLAYLVSSLCDPALWARSKAALMAKVAADRQRSLATCMLTFRDTSGLDWLEARVSVRKDALGVVALRALAVMNPHRALALLDSVEDGELYMSREWVFAELHLRLPAEVMAQFSARLRSHDKPWQYVLVLQGREDLVDPASFDYLLDRFDEALKEARTSDANEGRLPTLRRAISFINAVSRPVLLDRLRQRRGASLERELAAWLVTIGPQAGSFKEHDKVTGLDALARIGGDGLNQVLDDWLSRGDWYARIYAVKVAQRRATPRTLEVLEQLTRIDEPEDYGQRAALRGYAAAALASHGCWKPVLAYYLRVGTNSLTVVDECSPGVGSPLDDNVLGEVLSEFRKQRGPTPGSVLAVGLSGRSDLLAEVRLALRHADSETGLACACLIALQRLGDRDPATVDIIARFLPTYRDEAMNALLSNGSPAAEAALLNELRRSSDLGLAFVLMNKPKHRDAALEVVRRASGSPEFRMGTALVSLVFRLNPDALRAVANCQELYVLAEEVAFSPLGPFRVEGQKPAALRIVAQRQPEAASRLALSRLSDQETSDGGLYASLAVELSPDAAASALLGVLLRGPSGRVTESIGRQLRSLSAGECVGEWLTATEPERRLAACRVAGFLPSSEAVASGIRACADDRDREIAAAAAAALEQWRRARITEELMEAVEREDDLTHRWVLLDALIAMADPGEPGLPPSWAAAVRPFLTPAMVRSADERLMEKRKQHQQDLDRIDKRDSR